MAPTAHSKFGASGSARFIACPGSHQLSERAEAMRGGAPAQGSKWAAEGTAAHAMLEDMLRGRVKPGDRQLIGSGWSVDGHTGVVDTAFVEAVLVAVREVEKRRAGGVGEWIEQRVSLDKLWAPAQPPADLFGTADWIGVRQDTARKRLVVSVLDFKFGAGVAVEARDNTQLLYYALGALLFLDVASTVRLRDGWGLDVEAVIVQPRAQHPEGPVRVAHYSGLDVLAWGDEVLKPAVEKALAPDAPIVIGTHCRWCSALAICPAMKQTALDAARQEFGPLPPQPVDLTGPELADLLTKVEPLEAWLDALREEARTRIETGQRVPGWRVVDRKGRRSWTRNDYDTAAALNGVLGGLRANNVVQATTKINSPAEIEKLLTPQEWEKVLAAGLVSEGKASRVLVRDTDPRNAARRDPRADFDAITHEPI
ncbi:RecB family exonuclease [Microcystis phage Mae-Yong1326-1]|nr:RecB family exonuclease [Microcystis phage Mae-Yong1326-1]